MSACDDQSVPVPPQPRAKAPGPRHLTPPEALGGPVMRLQVTCPPGETGRALFAGLRRGGRLVARGVSCVPVSGPAFIELRACDPVPSLPPGDGELLLCLNRDERMSCHPSFGDLFLRAPLRIEGPEVPVIVNDPALWQERRASSPSNIVTIHYLRHDEDYDNVGIWTWDVRERRQPAEQELFEVGRDELGLVFQFDRGAFGDGTDADVIGLLPRFASDWKRKDGDDRAWKPELGRDIYLVGGLPGVLPKPPKSAPHIVAAYADTETNLVIRLSRAISPGDVAPEDILLRGGKNQQFVKPSEVRVRGVSGGPRGNELMVVLPVPLRIAAFRYEAGVEGFGDTVPLMPRGLLDDPMLFSDPEGQMGVSFSPEGSRFTVFAPTATAAWLVLYDEATGAAGRQEIPMKLRDSGIYAVTVPGNLTGLYYTYKFDGPELSPRDEVVDINASNAVDSGRRARITDLGATHPPGWERLKRGPALARPTDAVIYEMHVRDFTVSPTSGAPADKRGRYLGFALPGLRLPDNADIRTGLDHLVELGVTHVQLLPVQDFQNDESSTNYNWGYITVNFNSPEGQYASNPMTDARVREMKALVAALHERNIGVILDVVYNHTGSGAMFNRIVPGYYYRRTSDGQYMNASGCGNDFRSEAPMARKFIIDSLKFWVREYGIDGFRFDLMALLDTETMIQVERELRKVRSDILLYGEPWAAGAPSTPNPTDKTALRQVEVGAFNDDFRNRLKGAPDGPEPGFIQGVPLRDALREGQEGTIRSWAPHAWQSINYLTCHDNLVLFDKIQLSSPGASEEDILDMMRVGYLLLFTAQGVPFLHGGEEFARTKHGNHNSYEAGDHINQVDWSLKKKNRALFEWVRDLIALRRAHPILRLSEPSDILKVVSFPPSPDEHTVVMKVDGTEYFVEPWQAMLVVAHGGTSGSSRVTLPEGEWKVALDSRRAREGKTLSGPIDVPARSGLVLYQERKPAD